MSSKKIFWIFVILLCLFVFEMWNFSTTQYALFDVLGNLTLAGMPWATILATAFCGIDFAGIARIFTPESGSDEPAAVWYLFGAWFLASALNATLTWWAVSVAMTATGYLVPAVPIIVAVLTLGIRVLLINTISLAGDKLLII